MRLYIFADLKKASDRYHSSGGAIVIAEDREAAERLVVDSPNRAAELEEWGYSDTPAAPVLEWDKLVAEYEVGEVDPQWWVFPNAGCC